MELMLRNVAHELLREFPSQQFTFGTVLAYILGQIPTTNYPGLCALILLVRQ